MPDISTPENSPLIRFWGVIGSPYSPPWVLLCLLYIAWLIDYITQKPEFFLHFQLILVHSYRGGGGRVDTNGLNALLRVFVRPMYCLLELFYFWYREKIIWTSERPEIVTFPAHASVTLRALWADLTLSRPPKSSAEFRQGKLVILFVNPTYIHNDDVYIIFV